MPCSNDKNNRVHFCTMQEKKK
uniref:Uncharacterized protein n=1 Tax=Rhizophora mucronata TaxID=61149 RepID=A0A2P2PS62_RHIMU